MKINRRDFLKLTGVSSIALYAATRSNPLSRVFAAPAATGLSDPALQPKFKYVVPDALSPEFIYTPKNKGVYRIKVGVSVQHTGLEDGAGNLLPTTIWGYGDQKDQFYTWPGRTFQVKSLSAGGPAETQVEWINGLNGVTQHLLPVDETMHWCYSLTGYTKASIAKNGVPIITHLHGGHSDFQFDGNPEFFYSPEGNNQLVGPQWDYVTDGFTTRFRYDNDVPAGNLWYHDHALGITRLNVYAGLAGFYFVRDQFDTGEAGNPLDLPAWPYEKAYAIQDRMFWNTGELFYPAYPGDPFYDDFITSVGAILPPDLFPGGGPTALAEFFGDHIVVNGVIWPKELVEPRNYRLRLLNGTDSRFMALQFYEVPAGATDFSTVISGPLPFDVIGSDQGLASSPTTVDTLLSEPGSRYGMIFDFKMVTPGNRVIMKNIGGDEPFGGDIPGPQVFGETDRIMAFDVTEPFNPAIPDVSPTGINFGPVIPTPTRVRKVALFEGKDEFGRLQPLLGTAEPATDYLGNPINWPDTPIYQAAGLVGQMEGSIGWHSPTTENPALGATEEWEIWNMTGDAHPVHLHLVNFEVLGRQEMVFDSNANEDGFIPAGVTPADDGIYLVTQPVVQHHGMLGIGFKIVHPSNPALAYGAAVPKPDSYIENTPKDMVTALPGQITRIRATFDKPGRYVWHCHILSHEDHEMMRVLHVGEIPVGKPGKKK
ncbi:MAG: multicopper oxidase domain-containing protein [Anaerolineales bacterium]|nr:multicopper oxidase domain-containing protein [Anaerolineales bacterium]